MREPPRLAERIGTSRCRPPVWTCHPDDPIAPSQPGHRRRTTIDRYGADFIAARAREGLVQGEIAQVAHSERLKPAEIAGFRVSIGVIAEA
jgi:hypothetical protein